MFFISLDFTLFEGNTFSSKIEWFFSLSKIIYESLCLVEKKFQNKSLDFHGNATFLRFYNSLFEENIYLNADIYSSNLE